VGRASVGIALGGPVEERVNLLFNQTRKEKGKKPKEPTRVTREKGGDKGINGHHGKERRPCSGGREFF